MAMAVAHCIDERRPLVVEAGTGVGKTYAYLVPALLSGARTLLSTATKSLQDQLYLRDLPRLREALRVPITVALLKGRASYLCLHRLKQARETAELPDKLAVRTLAQIERWAQSTKAGDLAEISGLDERSPVIPIVTSTRENCLGAECPDHKACHVVEARRDAMAADLVVINHHLFFADLTLRDNGVAELLPSVEVAIFDEAHQLCEAGVQFLGTSLGTGQIIDLARDTLGLGLQQAKGLQPWQALTSSLDRAARELRLAGMGSLREVRGTLKLRWDERAAQPDFVEAVNLITSCSQALATALQTVAEVSPDLAQLLVRTQEITQLCAHFSKPAELGLVRWLDLSPYQVRLVESPLDIRDALTAQISASSKAWVFTSATLGDDDKLSWFTEPSGLVDAKTLRVGSPFDYARHARLYIPTRFPKPNEPDHHAAVADIASQCVRALGGRTFVLTTTLRAVQAVGAALQEALADADIQVLIQGQTAKRRLLQAFVEQPRSVLVGSQSFWEGIDVAGNALQCVLIDKLPFPPPHDPLVQARVKQLESQGRNAFADFFVAEAAVSLKQGAGRLIRSESDRGLLVVCDPRMAGMQYGQRLRQALPPMQRLATWPEALAWLGELAG
jgi:ATP-dependent DNA helicase DinG